LINNRPFVKICGITRVADLRCVVEAGASAVGFIGFPPSPRYISPAQVEALLAEVDCRSTRKVVVVVNATREEIQAYLDAGVDTVQLHGNEDELFAAQIPATIWKALRLKSPDEIERYSSFPCEMFVIDSFVKNSLVPGGTGHVADWKLAKAFVEQAASPVLLAGGISDKNALEALREVEPRGLDLSSGVEESPGIKVESKIQDLFKLF